MAKFTVNYVAGVGVSEETIEASEYTGSDQWILFFDADESEVARVRADKVWKVERQSGS